MSDENPKPVPTIDMDAIMARWAERDRRAAELRPGNKARLFAALAAAGISKVTVRFDGYGDSGQIEEIQAFAGQDSTEIPKTIVEIIEFRFHSDEPETVAQPLPEAIETLSYALLEQTHAGWENNEGAFGDFSFNVAEGTISLDYNERFESSENYAHEF